MPKSSKTMGSVCRRVFLKSSTNSLKLLPTLFYRRKQNERVMTKRWQSRCKQIWGPSMMGPRQRPVPSPRKSLDLPG